MAFFPREFHGANVSFIPLFRLLDDFENHSRQSQRHHRRHVPTFQPRFDVREVEDAYELHGELAGMNKNDVHIEFTDPQTLLVRGRIERSYSAGTPPAGLVENSNTAANMSGAIESSSDADAASDTSSKREHQATVEDEDEDGVVVSTPTTTAAELEKEPEKPAEVEKAQPSEPADKAKFWVSERSIGEFSRSFSFPVRVEQEAVSAKLENGILTVRVPKAPKHEVRRINIA